MPRPRGVTVLFRWRTPTRSRCRLLLSKPDLCCSTNNEHLDADPSRGSSDLQGLQRHGRRDHTTATSWTTPRRDPGADRGHGSLGGNYSVARAETGPTRPGKRIGQGPSGGASNEVGVIRMSPPRATGKGKARLSASTNWSRSPSPPTSPIGSRSHPARSAFG